MHYLLHNFAYGREFLGDADLNAQTLDWLDGTANTRVHGTTQEVPRVRFERDERTVLRPLAARPYRSLVLAPERATRSTPRLVPPAPPVIAVDRRPLAAYAQLAERV